MTTQPPQVEAPELLACPVCGDQPRWRGSQRDYAAGIFRLQCLGETHLFQAYGASEQKCITAWNTRTPDKRIAGLVSASKEALTFLRHRLQCADRSGDPCDCGFERIFSDLREALATFRETDRG